LFPLLAIQLGPQLQIGQSQPSIDDTPIVLAVTLRLDVPHLPQSLIQGWNWYAGADPTQVGVRVYVRA
jgi:hypothetical protein